MSPNRTQPGGRSRLLVIADDSPEMRYFVRSAIGDEFSEVVEVADGRELFMALLRSSFSQVKDCERERVIVTDLYMPTYDGFDVLDACQELDAGAKTVLITAFPSEAVRQRASELGAVLLAKPFSTAALRAVVRETGHGQRE